MSMKLPRYDYYQGAKPLGDLWTLKRGALVMRCALSTHSLGWELRLRAGSAFSRVQVCKAEVDVHSMADAWKTEALSKGWSE